MLIMAKSMSCLKLSGTFISPSHLKRIHLFTKLFTKAIKAGLNYLTFAEWWDLENLRSDDFLKEEYKGKKMMSIAELAYIAYSKKLLEGEPLDSFGQQRVIDKEKIQSFLPKLDSLIEKTSRLSIPPIFQSKTPFGIRK